MFCYHCGCQLSEHDFCTACGADVSLYKKIMSVSNLFYNEGLERAGVRDLSGAINSLRQSLKFNKNNIEARNLLGLVYFETGEVVAALSEWVISKNLRPERNIADDYIEMIQSNSSRLDAINQTIKKYNQALVYCTQDSKDLAIIQLKKVLSLNPKFVRAHQLLALLYMDSEQWERAQRELRKCMAIDINNTLTLRYMQEVDIMLAPDENEKQTGKRKKDESVRYQSDNDIIIQPLNFKEPKGGGVSTLLNIGIGLLVGAAAVYFLLVPAARSNANAEMQAKVAEISELSDAKTITIQQLEAQIQDLKAETEDLHGQLEGYVGQEGVLETFDILLKAATAYLETQDVQQTAENLENIAKNINVGETSEAFQNLYNALLGSIGPNLSSEYYDAGYAAYRTGDFNTAIENFEKAVYYDKDNGDALFYLGRSYHRNDNTEKAIATYEKVIELLPDTTRAKNSQKYINELTGN